MKVRSHANQRGAATMIISVLLMVSATLITLFAANYGLMQQKISGNMLRNVQAFEAAEAGLEYGINYLNKNSAIILASPSGGHIQPYTSGTTTNVVLKDGSKFSITYTNPVANNYNLILISVTGINNDATSTRTISQQVEYGSLLFKYPTNPLTEIGSVSMSSNGVLKNLLSNITIQSGGATTLAGNAETMLNTGVSSTVSFIGSDILANQSTLAATSSSDLFASYFGISPTAAKSKATNYFANLGTYNSVLNGLKGTTIWIDQTSGTASIYSTTTVGTTASPVILFVNGNLDIYGSATINGLVVLMGTGASTIHENSQINGGVISIGNVTLRGNDIVTYSSSILNTLQSSQNTYYAKVPGTWTDF